MNNFNSFNVVDNYNTSLKTINEQNIEKYFNEEILNKSKIDSSANAQLADEIYALDKQIAKEKRAVALNRGGMIFLRIIGGLLFAIGVIFIILFTTRQLKQIEIYIPIGIVGVLIGPTIFGLSWLVKKKLDRFRGQLTENESLREKKYQEARAQLSDVFNHLSDRMTFDIFEKTFPLIKFDNYFSNQIAKKWVDAIPNNINESTIFAISGQMHENPFVLWRTRLTEMYPEIYTGSITVMVRRTRRVNNRTESYMAPKVIVATTTNPAPRYWTETKLTFISSVSKELNYYNLNPLNHDRDVKKFYKEHSKMTDMDNPDFDRLFPCIRNDEIGFRTLYTPLAQEEMIKLIDAKNTYLVKKQNTVTSVNNHKHMDLYYFANRYYKHFDLRALKDEFCQFNNDFFYGVYFIFAPLLTIPLYIQTRYFDTSKGDDGYSHFSIESMANLQMDRSKYAHPESRTENILKAERVSLKNNEEIDEIIAYGYRTQIRVVIVPIVDFEAGLVNVPVFVIDYIPVSKKTTITTELKSKKIEDSDKKKMNFAWNVAILAAATPNEYKPNKDELLKTSPKVDKPTKLKKN